MAAFRNLLRDSHTTMRVGARSAAIRIAAAVAMLLLALLGGWTLYPKLQVHASAVQGALLLIHGYTDDCYTAFETTDNLGGTPSNTTTASFLTNPNQGWGNWYDPMIEVGYYTGDNSSSDCLQYHFGQTTDYPNYIQNTNDHGNCAPFVSNRSGAQVGTYQDPIEHLGCLLAWYIHDNFTSQGIPVYVLAHSMGGLIIRDAIGESGGKNAAFPSTLDVRSVVTVATPHGGVCCTYNQLAQHLPGGPGDTVELEDMLPGSKPSNFMQIMSGIQSPQATNGTSWYLMGASDACGNASGAQGISCLVEQPHLNDPYPDGDGIVQAPSALAMSGAAQKVLYGVVNGCDAVFGCNQQYTADSNTQYTHETDTPTGCTTTCLGSPTYLNDGTLGPQTTNAWVCYAPNCTDSTLNLNDVNIHGSAPKNPRSLQQVAKWLPSLAAPTPTPTSTPTVVPGACVQHPNDANCDDQSSSVQGCNSYAQSQTYNVSPLYVQLYYSTNCQSNWTYAKTTASGYALVHLWIEREETLAYPALNYIENPTGNPSTSTMVWAPDSPARSCATYKNLGTGVISNAYCTPWGVALLTCPNNPTDGNCTGQDYRAQTCNAYAQSSPAPVSNSYVSVTDYYSTNCESNWAVATWTNSDPNWAFIAVVIYRGAVSGGLGSTNQTSGNSRGDTTWWSQMVFAPNNPTEACARYLYLPTEHVYNLCTSMA